METLIFIACLMAATLGILAALYGICRGTKPDRGGAHYRRVRIWNFR
jgi:hypothetical protein